MTDREKVRNVSLVAHDGAGKSVLVEALLYDVKAVKGFRKYDGGEPIADMEEEEKKRNFTIYTQVYNFKYRDFEFNFLDTPGYSNFVFDAKNALLVSEGAVIIISAISGVKDQTIRFWEYLDEYELPRLIFINKLDMEKSDYLRAADDVEKNFGVKPALLQIPMGTEENFHGIIDLLENKAYVFETDGSGKFKVKDIPEEYADQVEEFRGSLIEAIVEQDDEMLERYLDGEDIAVEDLKRLLREGVISRKIVPAVLGSAARNIGIVQLVDAIIDYLPSPLERAPLRAKDADGNEVEIHPARTDFLSGIIFKTTIDQFAGKVSYIKIFSGSLDQDSVIYIPNKRYKDKIPQINKILGKKFIQVTEAGPGDIIAIPKLKEGSTGDTVCSDKHPVIFEDLIVPPDPVLAYAVRPKGKHDEEKMINALHKLVEEDPSLRLEREPQTKELLLKGLGQVQIETAVEKLKRKFGVEIELLAPKVPYRETIKKKAKAQGKYKKQTGGHGQYGDCWIEIEPLERGAGFEFVDKIVGGVIPRQFIPSVEKGIKEAMQKGPLAGYPVVDVKVTLFDGSHHPVDSSDLAFQIAGSMAFKKAVVEAQPVLLEPVMKMEIVVPEEYMGAITGDLNARRGKIVGVVPKAGAQVITAYVPLSEVLTYAPDLRSMTQGRGYFSMEFSHYEEVPTHLAKKIIEQAKAEQGEE